MAPGRVDDVRYLIVLLGLAASAAGAQSDAERSGQRWVCVPTEDRQWRCGRGENAPDPSPLPPDQPAGAPPAGYQPPADTSRLPGYLLQAPASPGEAAPETAEDEPAPADAGARTAPEPASPVEPATTVVEPAPEPDPRPAAEPADEGRYGIQLIAGRDRDSVEAYRDSPGLEALDVYRRTWEDAGGVWHVLLTGRFNTVAAARRALEDLPGDVRGDGAWVRPLEGLDKPSP